MRTHDCFGTAGGHATVRTDRILAATADRIDVHRRVRPVDHAHVVEVEVVPGVQVVLGERRRDVAITLALELMIAVPCLAAALAGGVEMTAGAAREAPDPGIGDCDGELLP